MQVKNDKIQAILRELANYLHGKSHAINLALIAFFSRGHMLVEDLPGLGKTTLAIAIAKILGLNFGRIQCTSDLLPTDITGLSIYKKDKGVFEFQKGPIFNNIVLVDEINRATSKTQSALLEAMAEKQVTIEGTTYKLPQPFFVIATQNPIEQFGTFDLPESQLDRFMMKMSIGYVSREAELDILMGGSRRDAIYGITAVMTPQEILSIQQDIRQSVSLSKRVANYIMDIVQATRTHPQIKAGLSTRAGLHIVYSAKTCAYFDGRDYVIPEDIKMLAEYVIAHRLIFKDDLSAHQKKETVKLLLSEIKTPA